jgi:hypothetical protein
LHVEAIGAAVDLRGAHLDEFDQVLLQTALLDIGLHLLDGAHRGGRGLVRIHALGLHRDSLWLFPSRLEAGSEMVYSKGQEPSFLLVHGDG